MDGKGEGMGSSLLIVGDWRARGRGNVRLWAQTELESLKQLSIRSLTDKLSREVSPNGESDGEKLHLKEMHRGRIEICGNRCRLMPPKWVFPEFYPHDTRRFACANQVQAPSDTRFRPSARRVHAGQRLEVTSSPDETDWISFRGSRKRQSCGGGGVRETTSVVFAFCCLI